MDDQRLKISRWGVVAAGTALQLCIGTIYSWSFFQVPIMQLHGWSNEAVTWIFGTAIFCLGCSAAWAGARLNHRGASPTRLAVCGAIFFGLGHLLAAFAIARGDWWLLWLGYGMFAGCGVGLCYVVPVATVAKWFPDKRGLVTGLVVMGFGLGALLMSKVLAPLLLPLFDGNLAAGFFSFGVLFLTVGLIVAWFLVNPPESASLLGGKASLLPAAVDSAGIDRRKFALLWGMFFCNIFAGISIISFQSPLLQDLLRVEGPGLSGEDLVSAGATLIAVSALSNGVGRLFWGAVSDRLGQSAVFSLLFLMQFLAFSILLFSQSAIVFGVLVCVILLCYGGGFGVMPSLVQQLFGAKSMAPVYGGVLTAWSVAGISGPVFLAWLRDHFPVERASDVAFLVSCVLMLAGLALSRLPALRTKSLRQSL